MVIFVVTIKVFGTTPPCRSCRTAERVAREFAETRADVNVVKYDALSEEGDRYGIMTTPTVVVGDEVICAGRIPSEGELMMAVEKMIGV